MVYTLVGSRPGTDYFSMTNAGQISISRDLNTDPARLLSYQVSQILLTLLSIRLLTAKRSKAKEMQYTLLTDSLRLEMAIG